MIDVDGYAIEYRNMSTALHGLIIFYDEDNAIEHDKLLDEMDDAQYYGGNVVSDEYYSSKTGFCYETSKLGELVYDDADKIIEEIDFRDVVIRQPESVPGYLKTWTDPFTRRTYAIVNLVSHDIYF